ncbi:hypothetical protein ES332_D02G266700v1 [Gossypium tomentosum]|uniref:TF-B3 domain-containing protein n=1 Tax=Gossypium tomentosum TaxID=34277 RepID=A0A5D2M2B8_GOSTO|nr:hypothetical protein ES332_D02G266700v1 [Gossypium tomentosum]
MRSSTKDLKSDIPNHDNRPNFFKLITHDTNANHSWRIPPAFVSTHLPKEVPIEAIFKGPPDHSLGDNDLLVFRHNGNMCFDVQIFDKTGVERKTGPMTGKHRDCSVEIKEEDDANQKNIPCPPVSIDFSSKFPYFKRCLTRCNVEHPFLLSVPSSFAKAKYLPETKKEFIFSATKQGYWKVGFMCSEIDKVFSHGWRKFVRDNELKVGNNCVFELWLLEKSKSIFSTSFICNV